MADSSLDLVVAGTADAVLMVEFEAKELAEDVMLAAVMHGHKGFQPVIDAIIKLAERAAKEPRDFSTPDNSAIEKRILDLVEADLRDAFTTPVKQTRQDKVAAAKAKVHRRADAATAPDRARQAARRPASSRTPRPRSCAGTSSTPACASTAAT